MSEVQIYWETTNQAAATWREQGDQLRGAGSSLLEVEPGCVGDRAAPALSAFREHWSSRVQAMSAEAHGNAEALEGAVDAFGGLDDAEAATYAGLLPYSAPQG